MNPANLTSSEELVRPLREELARQNLLITHYKQMLQDQLAATALAQENETRYRRIAEELTDYLYTVRVENGQAVETKQSPACLMVTGYAAEEFAANPYLWIQMVVPEDRDLVRAQVQQILAGNEVNPIEHRIIHKNGETRWVSDTTILCKDTLGTLRSYDGVIKDITERKRAARMLAEAQVRAEGEEKFRKITEVAQDAIIMMGADKCILLWNAAAERMFGYTAKEALGQEVHALLGSAESNRAFLRGYPHFQETGTGIVIGQVMELTALRKDGTAFSVGITISALQIDGQWNAIGILRDISVRKQIEQKIQASLIEKEVLMREIHHRVKNNMQMMSALLELQAGYVSDERALGFFKDSQQRIQSMAMIHEQLYHTKNLSQINFVAYLHSLLDKLRGQYSESCQRVAIHIHAQSCTLPVDVAIPCGLVVNELVSNVFKHAFPNGRAGELHIRLQCGDNGKILLEVTDDGIGLPAGLDIHHSKSFGMKMLTLMVEKQLHGKLSVESVGNSVGAGSVGNSVGAVSRPRFLGSRSISDTGTRVICEIGGENE